MILINMNLSKIRGVKVLWQKENTMQYAVNELMFLVEKYNLSFAEQTRARHLVIG